MDWFLYDRELSHERVNNSHIEKLEEEFSTKICQNRILAASVYHTA